MNEKLRSGNFDFRLHKVREKFLKANGPIKTRIGQAIPPPHATHAIGPFSIFHQPPGDGEGDAAQVVAMNRYMVDFAAILSHKATYIAPGNGAFVHSCKTPWKCSSLWLRSAASSVMP